MNKVQILTPCEHCNGDAYLPAGKAVSAKGIYTRYDPCPYCEGSGQRPKWISLRDFVVMLSEVALSDPMQPDWLGLAQHQPVSQIQDSRDAAGIP